MVSLYQGILEFTSNASSISHFVSGAAIMIMSLVLFENEFLHIVSISFTALILNELIMVALEITTWYVDIRYFCISFSNHSTRHLYMIVSEVVTLIFYIISIAFLPEYFGASMFGVVQSWMITSSRSIVRRYCRLCLEGGRHRSNQCASSVYHQINP